MSLRPKRDVSAASDKAACRLQSVLGVGHNFQSAQQARSTSAAPAGGPGGGLVGPGGNGLARAEVTTPNVQYDDGRMQGGLGGGRGDEAKPRRPWETIAAEKETQFVSSMEHMGGKYSGQIKHGVPSGFGTLKWYGDGKLREYTGAWRDGASSGDGTLTSYKSSGFRMKAEGAFGKNFQPVDVKVEYRHGVEKLGLASVTATPYLYGGVTGEKGTWYTAAFSGYKDGDFGVELYGVEDNGVSAAHMEWSGKSLDDFATSLMNEDSNAVLRGRVAFRPPSNLLKKEGLDDSVFLGMMEVKNGKARWRSEVRRHVALKDGFYTETTIGDAAETWKADTFDLEGMNDQRTLKEVQRKIDLLEKREEERMVDEAFEEIQSFLHRALLNLSYGMMAVIGLAGVFQATQKRWERKHGLVLELIKRSGHNDLDGVKALLAAGVNPNARNEWGSTALMLAARHGHLDVVKILIDAGADVNKGEYRDDTPLIYASKNGHAAVAEFLIAHGANVNATGERNGKTITALILASEEGHFDVVERLLAAPGIDVNYAMQEWTPISFQGWTPFEEPGWKTALWAAIYGNYPAVVELLIAHGANVNVIDKNGKTALSETLRRQYLGRHPPDYYERKRAIEKLLRDAGATE